MFFTFATARGGDPRGGIFRSSVSAPPKASQTVEFSRVMHPLLTAQIKVEIALPATDNNHQQSLDQAAGVDAIER